MLTSWTSREEVFGRDRVAELIRRRHAGLKKLGQGEIPEPAPKPAEDFQRKIVPEDDLPLA